MLWKPDSGIGGGQTQMCHKIFPEKKEANDDTLVDPLTLWILGNFIFSKWKEWSEDRITDFLGFASQKFAFESMRNKASSNFSMHTLVV